MIGLKVSAQTSSGSFIEGVVVFYDENSGKVTIRDEDNELYSGYEYQLEYL